jgi:MoxR-like ATPase
VLATQNPIEQEGTYPLPEAQLDRFLFMVRVDYPDIEEEREILRRTTGQVESSIDKVLGAEELLAIQEAVRSVPVADSILDYALALTRGTRVRGGTQLPFITQYVNWGAGPRASQALIIAAKARAALKGRDHVAIEDVKAVAHPVLRHRIVLNFSASAEGFTADDLIDRLLREVDPAAAVGAGLPGVDKA